MPSKVTVAEANAFYAQAFPSEDGSGIVLAVEENFARLRRPVSDGNRRPGGYISGPTQMAMADSAAYVAIFTRLGIVPMAVTSSLTMNFLRPCIGTAVMADAHLMKLGRSLAVIEVHVYAEGAEKTASHAMVTYALPNQGDAPKAP